MNNYGQLPKVIGEYNISCDEMLYYQYLPIKLKNQIKPVFEERLNCFNSIIGAACCDFIGEYGLDLYNDSYIYLTAKKMYQSNGCSFNRHGYHSDGFMTEDINYIWCDNNPTIFNYTQFNLSLDDKKSLIEMQKQADDKKTKVYNINTLLRLDQYNIHKVNDNKSLCLRTFAKISFSKDKYDLIGNSNNYLLDYKWNMRSRNIDRNIPQKLNT